MNNAVFQVLLIIAVVLGIVCLFDLVAEGSVADVVGWSQWGENVGKTAGSYDPAGKSVGNFVEKIG